MSIRKLSVMLLSAVSLAAFLGGCGSSSKESGIAAGSAVAAVSESKCRVCHSTSIGSASGSVIVTDYLASAHNLVPNSGLHYPDGIGCQGCHGGGAQHNGVGPIPFVDPSASGKCFECHKNYLPTAHFKSYTTNAGARSAMYASKNFQTDCSACHDPHKADKGIGQEHRDWAASKHGNVDGLAWSDRDFKATADCIRCHTSTGFINYVQSGFTVPTTTWAQPGDFTREVLTCKGCHTSYDFGNRVRQITQFTAPYTDAPTLFPDAKDSNLCVACHTGRISGDSIKNSTSDFSNTSFKNSHYLTAGGTVFGKSGYQYADRDYSIPVADTHDNIGLGTTGNAAVDAESTLGPCVGCHLNSASFDGTGSHTFSPLTKYSATDTALNPICVNCHATRGAGTNAAIAWLGSDTTAETFQGTTHKARYQAALEALRVQLAASGFNYSSSYPYFSNKNWISASDATGKLNMGAAFNYNLLKHDKGGVAHNRRYTRRLIYDSIDFLDDGILNYSVSVTLNAATGVYKASALSYLINTGTPGTAGERH